MEEFTLIIGKPTILIDEIQHRVNKLMGISDEELLEREITKTSFNTIDETQRRANELMGISDEEFLKYNGPSGREVTKNSFNTVIDETQRRVNKLMGISDEEFLRYRDK